MTEESVPSIRRRASWSAFRFSWRETRARVDRDGLIHPAEGGKALDRISWGAAVIPFSHHNDGVRDMMGAKNLRQATPVLKRERPAVRTGGSGLVRRVA